MQSRYNFSWDCHDGPKEMRAQMSDGDGKGADELRPAEPWSDGYAKEDPGEVVQRLRSRI